MAHSELNKRNYARITRINFLLSGPMLLIFGWPYFQIANALDVSGIIAYLGLISFSLPLTITILHGHIALALGEVHRYHYYNWQNKNPYLIRLIYNPMLFSFKIRLILIMLSAGLLLTGYILKI